MRKDKLFFVVVPVVIFLINIGFVNASSIVASLNKITFALNEQLTVDGSINGTGDVSAVIYNSSGIAKDLGTTSVSSSGSFNFSYTINNSFTPPRDYNLEITSGADNVNMSFKVVSSIIYLEPHLIGDPQKTIQVSTSTRITSGNAGFLGGNFSELIALSQNSTKAVYYGNATITLSTGNKPYHFVLVDENSAGSYDTLYVDDDVNFLMYNTSEDAGNNAWEPERIKRMGEGIKLNSTDEYVVGYIDFNSGNKILLAQPINTSVYSGGDLVHFVIISKNSQEGIAQTQPFVVNLTNSTGYVFNSTSGTTNNFGIFISNFTVPSTSGRYIINVNDSLGLEFFSVETFKLYGKMADLLDNPTSTFAPNPAVRISATTKKANGDPIDSNEIEINAIVKYPNGTSQTVTLTGGNGTFTYDLNLAGSPQGEYGVKIIATYSGNMQEFSTGFAIRSVSVELMAINTEYINEIQGEDAFVDAFAPNKNVSLMVVLSNVSSGGFFSKGPGGEGTVDIDDPATGSDECNTSILIVSVEDERGKDITANISYRAMNLTNAMNYMSISPGEEEGGPPEAMLRQCMIVFTAPSRTGIYRIKVNVQYNGDNFAGTTFGVQRYYATANPVDFTGEKDFWFYAPNSTIYIKLKVTDLSTREELNATNITDAEIFEMFREWPSYQDMLTGSYKTNASMVNGVINFTTPDSEGFFDFTFKFKTNSGEGGLGTGFFMLKKYMIWGESLCEQSFGGPCMFGPGKNVTITVKIIPISKADRLDQKMTDLSQIGYCTDCNGLIASVNSIWNDQLMKQISSSDYTVYNGTIFNSTANITIEPGQNMPTGWFGVDLILNDPTDATKQYFGWAGFEIRRIMIINDDLETNATGQLKRKEGGTWGATSFALGQPVIFGISARSPASPGNCLNITSVSFETIRLMSDNGPPLTLQRYRDYNYTIEPKIVSDIQCQSLGEFWVMNITGINRKGNIQANYEVNTNIGSDVWSYWFVMSSFFVDTQYRGMNEWPPTFSPSENLTVNITATNYNLSSHDLSQQGTRLKMVMSMKSDTKTKLNSSTTCNSGFCRIDIYCPNVAGLGCLGSGEFNARIVVNDTNGIETDVEVYFVIKGLTVSVPSIEELWVGRTDSPTKELNLDNDRDRCDNDKWLDWDGCQNENYTICTNNNINFTVSSKYINNNNFGKAFCINSIGEWQDTQGGCQGTIIYVISNSTHAWISTSTNMTGAPPRNNETNNIFTYADKNWQIINLGDQFNPNKLKVKDADGICGEMNNVTCDDECQQYRQEHPGQNCPFNCQRISYIMIIPGEYSYNYHGYITNLRSDWVSNDFGQAFIEKRPLYVYHNTTHIWISDGTNLTNAPVASANEEITDPYGGIWKVKVLNARTVELEGQNVLAETGAFIDTSLSKSGNIRIEPIRENQLGGWDQKEGRQRGIDLSGNGLTNDTVYVAVTDNATTGVYDTFFFSKISNFSSPIPVNAERTTRKFGNDKLTLLSISSISGVQVRAYSDKPSDWANLGQFKVGSNVNIPIIVKSPTGDNVLANVSIDTIRMEISGQQPQYVTLSSPVSSMIDGIGEITVNFTSIGLSQSGQYALGIKATNTSQEKLEEYKWPSVTMRGFVIDSAVGDGGYVGTFYPLPLTRYDWESYGNWIPDLETTIVTDINTSFEGVFSNIDNNVPYGGGGACVQFAEPNNAGTGQNWTMNMYNYWLYINSANESTVWIKSGDCNFTTNTLVKNTNNQVNLTINSENKVHTYMLYVLYVNVTSDMSRRVIIGAAGINSNIIKPIRVDQSNPKWKLMALNLSGTLYDVILSNETFDYPMCGIWNLFECAKVAWLSTNGNFSGLNSLMIGQNFTSDLYLAKVGAGPWEGITIGNFTQINSLYPNLPGIDIRPRDNTTSYFARLDESVLGLDLNKNGNLNDVFYAVAFDDKDDNLQSLTRVVVDDDLNITEEWWANYSANSSLPGYYRDFYENEYGMKEMSGNLPRGVWSGNMEFNVSSGLSYEQSPQWEIVNTNTSHMMLRKWKNWFKQDENVTLILKVFEFNQTGIPNANVTIENLMKFSNYGFPTQLNSPQHYNVTGINVTDNYGYVVIKLIRNTPWQLGDYNIRIRATASGNRAETADNWFNVRP
jgi:hypothetical protein